MKIFANTKKNEFSFDWIEQNGESYLAKDGKRLDVELVALGDGRFSLIKDNMPYIVNISKNDDGYQVRVAGDLFHVQVEDERTRKVKELVKAASGGHGEKTIKAPIPGLVIKIQSAVGDIIKEGDGLLILEAMKMENIIKAPYNCEVLEIAVKESDTVNQNQVLIKIKGLTNS
jgi:biotin carboxyl carrier protein